jgi:hypothetical protein
MADPNAVGDTSGEWFEVYAVNTVDLNDLELGQSSPTVVTTFTSANCESLSAGSYRVFARNADMATNGGLPPGVIDYQSLGLTNSNGSLFIGHGGAELDALTWVSSSAGVSSQLDPAMMMSGVFCDATSPYGSGDLGTPEAANDACN